MQTFKKLIRHESLIKKIIKKGSTILHAFGELFRITSPFNVIKCSEINQDLFHFPLENPPGAPWKGLLTNQNLFDIPRSK